MVVKAFFIGSHLWPIQEVDRRGNPRLARMLDRSCPGEMGGRTAGER